MIRITTLIENSMGEHLALKNEHGQAFCVETGTHKILFDTGQSPAFIGNAAQLRIDLSDLDFVVLSHGHYDHSGGLRALSDLTTGFELVVGKGFFEEKYAEMGGGGHEFLGNNFTEEFLKAKGIRHSQLSSDLRELVPGIFVLGTFPRIHPDEVIKPRFKLLRGGQFIPDHFDDEIMLAVETPKGLVALLGCSHPGMRNMLDAVASRMNEPIFAVLGGTHLVEASPESMSASVAYLEKGGFGAVGVSHCTGSAAMKALELSKVAYFHNRTGSSLLLS
jgi:7,8-dihydropterin-6-yl-methyl-4-(beta-D-ribofuranosyl)aminobenzene 5'-phosphate synthase